MTIRLRSEEFIRTAMEKHANKFGYENVVYVNAHSQVQITCLKCNKDFLQRPCSHLQGYGCRICSYQEKSEKKRKTRDEFIKDAVKVHGDKYLYDKSVYINGKTPIIITCVECDEDFQILPETFLCGRGCRDCGYRRNGEKSKKTRDEFIKDAVKVHGDKYLYDKSIYIDSKTHIIITCLTCNEDFSQLPGVHTQGSGCPECAKRIIQSKNSFTLYDFVQKAIKVHGNKYSYKNCVYINNRTKCQITCPKCKKDFSQRPEHHLRGCGCPTCVNKTEWIVASKLQEIFEPLGFKVEHMGNFVSKGIGKMDIRITKEELTLFVEVDGFQHFRNVKHQKSKVVNVQKRDLEKHLRVVENGHKVIRIDQEWVWNSQAKNKTEWASRLRDTIVTLDSGTESSIDEMSLSDKPDKYHDHLCYIQCHV